MTFVRDRRPARRARELLVAAGGAVLLLLALWLPVLGAPPGPTKLLDPGIAPGTADSATPVTFTITYRNAHALPPDYVRVAVAGATYPMTGAGTDWKAGVVFTVTTTLPAGTHEVRFEARDAERFVDELAAGTVSIDVAPPAPDPTPEPTPEPPPAPTPAPTPTPEPVTPPPSGSSGSGSTGTSGSGGASGGGSTDGTTGSSDTGTGAATTDADGIGGLGDGPDGASTGRSYTGSRGPAGPDPSGGSSDSGTGSGAQTGSGGGSSADGGFGVGSLPAGAWSHRPWFMYGSGSTGPGEPSGGEPGGPSDVGGPGGGAPPDGSGSGTIPSEGGGGADGSDGPRGPGSWLQASLNGGLAALGLTESGYLPTLPAVVGSTLMVTTWMAFMLFNKRRRDGEPPAPDDVLQAAAATGIGMGVALAPAPVAPPDPEALMPRWRRPSLLEARKTDPIRSPAPERQRLSFAIGEVAASLGSERRTIRYAVIPLLDRPDEILASRIGELIAGDEVQVEQRSGAYCHVLCPDGRQGWVHRTTLGDVVEARPPGRWATEPEPEAENALAAMLAARGLR